MAYQRPALLEIIKNIEADIYARFNNDASTARFSVNKVLSRVIGGACHLLYGKIDYAMKQLLPDTCDEYFLKRWALMYRVEQKPATKSYGKAIFEGINGAQIPAYSQWETADNFIFQTTEKGKIENGKAVVAICAMNDGAIGNLPKGIELKPVTPISSIKKAIIDESGTHSGSDVESLDEFRERVLFRICNPVSAGTKEDYENWLLEIPGVTRAWCYRNYPEKGSVGLAFLRDNDAEQIPNAEQNEEVKENILQKCPIITEIEMITLKKVPMNFHLYVPNSNVISKEYLEKIFIKVIKENGSPQTLLEVFKFEEALRAENIKFKLKMDNVDLKKINCDVKTNDKQIHTFGSLTLTSNASLFEDMNS
ncbi:baseplate J/gp47 family protein [Silvanigrella aquatica]|uniref:Uncharacterized protein n=1 Tax=Silvanigrella aquatica TaxID=1915309 RepID=A0A1L4D176_9BACT|nr:baseplate J/gp47 family protein [Silvanigrella aquatica]APJ03946.1 hypothetical protein AXG55_08520 [Silvanigrella aquatica]